MNYEPKKEIAEKLLESFNEKLYFDVIKKYQNYVYSIQTLFFY